MHLCGDRFPRFDETHAGASQRIAAYMQSLILMACIIVLSTGWSQDRVVEYDRHDIGFTQFLDGVQKYAQLHRVAEAHLPALKPTDAPKIVAAHEEALAKMIRDARPTAEQGDIFTEAATTTFRRTIVETFRSASASHARATIQHGNPVGTVSLRVNESYPKRAGFTTVPPTLLLEMPPLPKEITYRIVGRDLVLFDVTANLVVDLLPKALP
jgi:hypothetical protein